MNIVIVGGGTLGWLVSLLVNKVRPELNITLIESEEIGILGAGEGTTNLFVEVLNFLNIPISDFYKECDATGKLGINFQNWNGDGKSYFHPFILTEDAKNHKEYVNRLFSHIDTGGELSNINLLGRLADLGKMPYSDTKNISSFGEPEQFALHFNARETAKYLKKVAISRGIKHIEGKVTSVETAKNKIFGLTLANGSSIPTSFVFDCSGFSRLLIGNHYKSNWISYKESLPLDTALPFFIPHDGNIKTQTDAIAMKYGWMWKIPTQTRYGCGYVFNSEYIDVEEAQQEVEELLGHSIEPVKPFKFNAGTYDTALVENCLAVGLAQSFVEPLEASSIWVSCINILEFLKQNGLTMFNESEFRSKYNAECLARNYEIVDFIYMHYLTKRTDSLFWSEFRTKTTSRSGTYAKMNYINGKIKESNLNETSWTEYSYIHVMEGLGLINRPRLIDTFLTNKEFIERLIK